MNNHNYHDYVYSFASLFGKFPCNRFSHKRKTFYARFLSPSFDLKKSKYLIVHWLIVFPFVAAIFLGFKITEWWSEQVWFWMSQVWIILLIWINFNTLILFLFFSNKVTPFLVNSYYLLLLFIFCSWRLSTNIRIFNRKIAKFELNFIQKLENCPLVLIWL